jgi:hypothetical protein
MALDGMDHAVEQDDFIVGGVADLLNVMASPTSQLALRPLPGYCKGMVDLKLQVPTTDKVEVDAGTLAAIDRGIKDADEGRTVPIDEVRKMLPTWISKFESRKPR